MFFFLIHLSQISFVIISNLRRQRYQIVPTILVILIRHLCIQNFLYLLFFFIRKRRETNSAFKHLISPIWLFLSNFIICLSWMWWMNWKFSTNIRLFSLAKLTSSSVSETEQVKLFLQLRGSHFLTFLRPIIV